MANDKIIEQAKDHFGKIIERQLNRLELIKQEEDWTDFRNINPIVIGVLGGDGIGPYICRESQRILEYLLTEPVKHGNVKFINIKGLSIENRAKHLQSIPDDVMTDIKKCHVTLKGPTHTPEKDDGWPNLESANVGMRKELDLFANVRPVRIPSQKIDWVFFRENTEDLYAVGNQGINVTSDLAIDFRVITTQGSARIIEAAFDYAMKHEKDRVTIVTKANIIKTTDGKFLDIAKEIASRYPKVDWDSRYIDIMTANLLDERTRHEFQVFALPNLYGDILTDEAAQIQGGVGTAGSANIGKRYAMFEAIHGSAPRMVSEGRAEYADPSSMIRASSMLLEHIGYADQAMRLNKALDICTQYEKKLITTGRSNGCTSSEFGDYLMATIEDPNLQARWESYLEK